jgi:hypothetical protein
MKRALLRSRRNYKLSLAGLSACCVANVAVIAKGLRYIRAAQKDEKNNFPYTAAMEWRLAAEFFGAHTLAAEYCWRHWESIMRLSHRFNDPIGDPETAAVSIQLSPVVLRQAQTSPDRVSLRAAA